MGDHRCILCPDFVTSDQAAMKRHVAIGHGKGTFSTWQCNVCHQKYYDFDHFREHTVETPSCFTNCFKITPVPLGKHLENAFHSLVDQMMKPTSAQSVPVVPFASKLDSGENSAPSNDQIQTPSKNSHSIMEPKMESNGSEIPQFDQTPMDDENGLQNVHESMDSMELSVKEKMDLHHQVDAIEKAGDDGLEPVLEIGQARVDTTIEESTRNKTRFKHSVDELRLHCRQLISKHHHGCRITCLPCNGSISVKVMGKSMNTTNALHHIRSHFPIPLFCCQLCTFESNHPANIRVHLAGAHSKASGHYVDKLANHVEEMMQMVTQCFDHGVQTGGAGKGRRQIKSKDHGSTTMSNEQVQEDQMGNITLSSTNGSYDQEQVRLELPDNNCSSSLKGEDPGSISNAKTTSNGVPPVCTLVGGLKLRINLSKLTKPRSSTKPKNLKRQAPQERSRRYKIDHGRNVSMDMDSSQSQGLDGESTMNDSVIKQRSKLPPNILVQKRDYSSYSKKFIKDGKLECNLCQKQVIVSQWNDDNGNPLITYMENAYRHATSHLCNSKMYECGTCGQRSSDTFPMYSHVRENHGPGKHKLIDHTTEHYPEILQMFLKCFTDEMPVHSGNKEQKPPKQRTPRPVVNAWRACFEKVKKFVKNGRLKCQVCSTSIVVKLENSNGGSKCLMTNAISHATRHMEGCHLFECSHCHVTKNTRISMYYHTKQCQNGAKFINHSDRYYQEICNQFLACFDLERDLEQETSTSKDKERGTQIMDGGNGMEKEGEEELGIVSSKSALMDSTEDTKKWLVCTKCGYKSENTMLFRSHQKVMHSE